MKQTVLVNSSTQNMLSNSDSAPVSRTYQYRKVMKPMLERKRRARINRCLDELKELMLIALQAEGENVAKLEKADILEHTVIYLHKLRKQNKLMSANLDGGAGFHAGYTHCAREISKCLAITPGIDIDSGTKLMTYLGHKLNDMNKPKSSIPYNQNFLPTPPSSPASCSSSSSASSSSGYCSGSNRNSPNSFWNNDLPVQSGDCHSVWRPW